MHLRKEGRTGHIKCCQEDRKMKVVGIQQELVKWSRRGNLGYLGNVRQRCAEDVKTRSEIALLRILAVKMVEAEKVEAIGTKELFLFLSYINWPCLMWMRESAYGRRCWGWPWGAQKWTSLRKEPKWGKIYAQVRLSYVWCDGWRLYGGGWREEGCWVVVLSREGRGQGEQFLWDHILHI